MKKIIYGSLILAALFLGSCDVEVSNPNVKTNAQAWETENDAQLGINAVYNMFNKPATYSRWFWFRHDLTSDEGFSGSPWTDLKNWTEFKYNDTNFDPGNGETYSACYKAIFRANQVITNVPKIQFKNENYKNQIIAQAYFLRGLYYYHLATLWGSEKNALAIMLEPSTPDMKPQGHNVTEVYNQAIADFGEASKYLPEEWTNVDKGRATKGAALAFRAKCYMQMHKWTEAKTDLDWLVTGAGKKYYDLMPAYGDNFTKDKENNIESVFEAQYSDIHPSPAGDGDDDSNPNLGQNRGQFFGPPTKGWTDGEYRPWIVDEFKKEKNLDGGVDIRLKHTAFYSSMHKDFENNNMIYDIISNDDKWNEKAWKGRVFFRKYATDGYRTTEDNHSPINIRVIRYADVLLMQAECIAQTGGSLSEAVALVDRVRARVNMPSLAVNHAPATTSKDAFLKRLQMERTLELSSEGHRWADIKRWGLTQSKDGIDELKRRDEDFNNFITGKHECMPIPSIEVNNNPNIEQNTNY